MPLTEDEAAFAGKMVRRMERQGFDWAFARWVILAASVVYLAMAAFYCHLSNSYIVPNTDDCLASLSTRPSADEIRLVVQTMKIEQSGDRLVWMFLLMGIGFGLMVLVQWNRGRKQRLMAHLLREHLLEKYGLTIPEARSKKNRAGSDEGNGDRRLTKTE
jgi:hypothetical protein